MTCYKCGKETGTPFAECEHCAYGHPDIGVEIKSVAEMRDMSSPFNFNKIYESEETMREFLMLYLNVVPGLRGCSLPWVLRMFIQQQLGNVRIVKGHRLHDRLKNYLVPDPQPPKPTDEPSPENPS